MISYVGMNPFIATLAGMQAFRGIAYILTNARSISVRSDVLQFIGRQYTFGIPNPLILMLILVVIFNIIAWFTSFGRRILVIGGNEKVAYLSGINVKRTKMWLFIVHGLVTGIAAVVYISQLGAALPSAATNLNFQTISAVVLGGVSLTGGKGSIVGAIIGALLLGTLNNGMIMLDIQSFWQDVITGVVLIIAVSLDIIKNNRSISKY
jgi:ribose transport system permease protein